MLARFVGTRTCDVTGNGSTQGDVDRQDGKGKEIVTFNRYLCHSQLKDDVRDLEGCVSEKVNQKE